MVTANDRIGFLTSVFYDAQDKNVALYSLLICAIRGAYSRNGAGQTVIATSGNGRSVSLLMPDFLKTLTPDEARRMWVDLWNIWQQAMDTLGLTDPTLTQYPNPNAAQDANIYNAMLASDAMQKITSYLDDFTAIRYPSFGPATT